MPPPPPLIDVAPLVYHHDMMRVSVIRVYTAYTTRGDRLVVSCDALTPFDTVSPALLLQ